MEYLYSENITFNVWVRSGPSPIETKLWKSQNNSLSRADYSIFKVFNLKQMKALTERSPGYVTNSFTDGHKLNCSYMNYVNSCFFQMYPLEKLCAHFKALIMTRCSHLEVRVTAA